MSEEKSALTPQEQPDTANTSNQEAGRQQGVFRYIAILFAAAFVLLLLTFLMERRQNERLLQENQEQIDTLQKSVSATQRLEDLYDENAALKDQLHALEEELEAAEISLSDRMDEQLALKEEIDGLTGKLEAQEKQLQAMDWFWQIDEAYVRGRKTLCLALMEHLDAAGLAEHLPRESAAGAEQPAPYERYQEIRQALGQP